MARFQAKREITSYWFPIWLAQPAALVEGSKLMDASAHRQTVEDGLKIANDYELFILYTSTPSLNNDTKCAEAIKSKNPHAKIGFIGPHVAVLPEPTLRDAPAIRDTVPRYRIVRDAIQNGWVDTHPLGTGGSPAPAASLLQP